jgi:hypothetical protein
LLTTFLDNGTKRDTNNYMRFSKVFQPQQEITEPKRDKRIQPVRTAAQLLDSPERIELTQEIQDLSGANAKDYALFYGSLINRFAEFVQLLASYEHPAFTFLDHHLRLAKTVLKMREQYLLVGETLHPIITKQEALWHYVLFSSALLSKVGLLFTHYQVSICNEQGQHQAAWNPFAGPISEQGSYYKLQDVQTQDTVFTKSINQLIARQIMPEEGFAWIASDKDALLLWLGIVEGEQGGGVSLQFLALSEKQLYDLKRIENILEKIFLDEKLEALLLEQKITEQELLALLPLLHGEEKTDNELSVIFYDWLNTQIKTGVFKTNQADSLVFIDNTTKQYVIAPQVLALFAQTQRERGQTHWMKLYQNAIHLGLTTLTASDLSQRAIVSGLMQARLANHRATNELFHQTLHDKAQVTTNIDSEVKGAQMHKEALQQTVASMNRQGYMLGGIFGSMRDHLYAEKYVGQQHHQDVQNKLDVQSQDLAIKKTDEQYQHRLVEQQKHIESRHKELRAALEKQYTAQSHKAGIYTTSQFTYTSTKK